MRLVATLLTAAATVLAAVPATAGERLTDAAYLRAARCQGLAHATKLGVVDTTAIDAFMKEQGDDRRPLLRDKARNARTKVLREAATARAHPRLIAERNQRCAAWFGPEQVASVQTAGSN